MHEVSLRAASNRMDAHNLAVVLCPNLVSGSDPMRDVAICIVPGGPVLHHSASPSHVDPTSPLEGKTTLGTIIKLCIQRYYEIFDEVQDRSEAIPRPLPLRDEPQSPGASSFSSGNRRYSGFQNDDDEEIDDAMLVMPIGPSPPASSAQNGSSSSSPPQNTAWDTSKGIPYKARHRRVKSGGRSMHAAGENDYSQATVNKAKSMISIDNGLSSPGARRGSISVGRCTTRKSSGAAVEAISVTAEGFFSAPNSAPPVPSLPSREGHVTGSPQCS